MSICAFVTLLCTNIIIGPRFDVGIGLWRLHKEVDRIRCKCNASSLVVSFLFSSIAEVFVLCFLLILWFDEWIVVVCTYAVWINNIAAQHSAIVVYRRWLQWLLRASFSQECRGTYRPIYIFEIIDFVIFLHFSLALWSESRVILDLVNTAFNLEKKLFL